MKVNETTRCLALLVTLAGGCNDDSSFLPPTAPEPVPTPTPTPAPVVTATYAADAIGRVDTTAAACGWVSVVGQRLQWEWSFSFRDGSIELLDDPEPFNAFRYVGTLTGRDFVVTTGYLGWDVGLGTCTLREIWVSGTFSEDRSSFVAYQTFIYNPTDSQTTQEWRWNGRRL